MCITLVVGGARSGKSTFAENKVKEYGESAVYIATAVITDSGMAERVKKHIEQRPKAWKTIERYKNFDELSNDDDFINAEVVIIDCLTTLITNFMIDSKIDFDDVKKDEVNLLEEKIKDDILKLLDICRNFNKKLVIVSNEVGLGVVPAYYMGNYFRDISGRVNSMVAQKSDNMYFIVSGIPLKLKSKGVNLECSKDF